jgi:hypothetical protein
LWREDSSVSTVQTETKPMSNRVKRFWFDFKLLQSVPRVFWRHFDIWTLGKGSEIQISEFLNFPIGP